LKDYQGFLRVPLLALDTPVQYVKGIGPHRAEQLAGLGISTVEDLLLYFPRRFNLRRQAQPIETLKGDEPAATVAGVVGEVQYKAFGRLPYLACTLDDGTAVIMLKWFHGGYLRDTIKTGLTIAAAGKVSVYKETLQLANPRFQIIHDVAQTDLSQDELLPVYPAMAAMPSSLIGRLIQGTLDQAPRLFGEWFDQEHLRQRQLVARPTAIAAMHRPEDSQAWERARRRLAYDELVLMQLGIALQRLRAVSQPAFALSCTAEIDRRIRARFPFVFTGAQDRAVSEIAADLARPRPMNRLLQGDVGSGKTAVSLYAALLAVAHRKQVAIMAPTEILARQHFQKVEQYLAGSRVRWALLVGGQKSAERGDILARLAAGQIDIIVGTHALLSEDVQFAAPALVVVDEQHKFGVKQRVGIRAKGHAPHCLVMTATPIPRTLALTVFGDLDVSVIDQLPPGRGRTDTKLIGRDQFAKLYQQVRQRLTAGEQAYFVYPLVAGQEDQASSAALSAYQELARGPFAGFTVGLIHGQMPRPQQREAMARFAAGQIQVLVASTVVEVGLDVPNANAMVVMHAERFGLAQLHQLRGRVGRGKADAVCVLVAATKDPVSLERLAVLEKTSDGFKIAEEDLRLRGPGEFFGTRQHGLPELKVAELIEDFELLRLARRDAFAMVNQDPDLAQPHHQALRAALVKTYGERLRLIAGG
jgi:ATP-dependent DNA helicase RecG